MAITVCKIKTLDSLWSFYEKHRYVLFSTPFHDILIEKVIGIGLSVYKGTTTEQTSDRLKQRMWVIITTTKKKKIPQK